MAAAVQRIAMDGERQCLTLRQTLRTVPMTFSMMFELWRKLGDGGEEGGVTGLVIKPPESPRWSVTP